MNNGKSYNKKNMKALYAYFYFFFYFYFSNRVKREVVCVPYMK